MIRTFLDKLAKASLMLAFCFVGSAFAQEQTTEEEAPQTIVVLQSAILTIETDRLFSGSMFGQRVQREFAEAYTALNAENREKEAELSSEEAKLTELRPTLSREEFTKLADDFDIKAQRIRSEQITKETDIRAKPDQARQEFLRIVRDVIVEIMRERRALAVFEVEAVFIAASSLNITDEAIARIDALIGDGTSN